MINNRREFVKKISMAAPAVAILGCSTADPTTPLTTRQDSPTGPSLAKGGGNNPPSCDCTAEITNLQNQLDSDAIEISTLQNQTTTLQTQVSQLYRRCEYLESLHASGSTSGSA